MLNQQNLDKTEQSQLLSYGAVVELQIFYNRREEYFTLIKEYLAKKINPSTFRGKFLEMQEQNTNTT